MATFEAQVEALTGLDINESSNPTQSELSQFLTDGAKDVISRLMKVSPVKGGLFSTTEEITNGDGVSVSSGIVLDVVRGDGEDSTHLNPAGAIAAGLRYRATDENSLYYRSKYNPCWYMRDGKCYILPTPGVESDIGNVTYITYPDIEYSDTEIPNFGDEYEPLVVIYTGIRSLENALASKTLPDDIVFPLNPAGITLDTITMDLPVFEGPSGLVLPTVPTDVDIDFTGISLDLSGIIPPTGPVIPDVAVDISSLTLPTFVPPAMESLDWDDTNTWISEEDTEMLGARISEISAKVSEYSARMQEAQSQYNKENGIYTAELQTATQNASLESGKIGQDLQAYSAELQKYNAEVSSNTSEYQQKVNKVIQAYQAETGYDMSKYQAEVQAVIQKFQQDLASDTASFRHDLEKYQGEVQSVSQANQNKATKYNAEIQAYQSEVSALIQDYNARVQASTADYQQMQSAYQSLLQQYLGSFPAPQQQEVEPQQRRRK